MINHRANLISGPIGPTLTRLAIPMVWGLLAIISFNLVDTFFVARLGTEELAAISFTFPVVMVLMSTSLGLGIGAASVIARAIGKGNHSQVQRLTTDSLLLAFTIVAGIVFVGLKTIDPLFRFLGATETILPLIKDYIEIWYWGVPCVVIPMVGNSAIRASGDTRIPGMIMCLAATINAILDPILIFGLLGFPAMGISGAATATVISYCSTLVISLYVLHYKKNMLTFSIKIKEMILSWKQIIHIAVPAVVGTLSAPIINAFTIWLLAKYGPESVGGFGIASRVESFCMIFIMALGSAFGPFAGQNWGARQYDRIVRGMSMVYRFAVFWGILLAIVLGTYSNILPKFFQNNPMVILTAGLYFRIVPISYFAMGITFLAHSFFNATGQTKLAYFTGTARLILFVIFALIGESLFGISGIFGALLLANLLVGCGTYFYTQDIERWSQRKF